MNDPATTDPLERIYRDMLAAPGAAPGAAFPGFTLREKLGSGGFGVVYRALEERLQRDVALKFLHGGAAIDGKRRERFLAEARALARVRHPNVLVIHGVLENEGEMALCTELIEGSSLARILADRGRLAEADAIRVGIEACRALDAVHAAGIVHRDVKTTNILVESTGRVVLADFGLGALAPRTEAGKGSTSRAGSPVFMSPEQTTGAPVDPRSDLYSLGVVLYNLTTGAFPFDGEELEPLLRRIREEEPVPPSHVRPELSPGFVAVVMRALAKDPGRRYANAHEMEGALRRALEAIPEAPAAPSPSPGGAGARRAGRIASLIVLTCLALTGAWLLLRESPAPAPAPGPSSIRITAAVEDAGAAPAAPDRDGDAAGPGEEPPAQVRIRRVRLALGADRPLHVYALQEDRRGRKYMLFPDPTGANPLPAGEAEPLPGAEDGWLLSCAAPGEFLLLIAATEPIGPLEDARPLTPSRSTTGRRGEPRLKPVTVRGLFRRLGEIDPRRFGPLAGEEPQALLSSAAIELQTGRLVSLPVPGVCLARIALTEAADER